MGRRKWIALAERGIRFTHCWPGPGIGKYWKRKLNKARRKYSRLACRGKRGKDPSYLEGIVNYRTW